MALPTDVTGGRAQESWVQDRYRGGAAPRLGTLTLGTGLRGEEALRHGSQALPTQPRGAPVCGDRLSQGARPL